MSSLQLLKLTEQGRNLLSSRRKTLVIVSGALLAGGTLTYAQSCRRKKYREENSRGDASTHTRNKESNGQNGVDGKLVKPRKKKNLLKSLHFLAAILLKKIGPSGTNYLLGLMLTAVIRTAIGHRLAKVQGYLFRSAFLRRVPTFMRLIIENLLLCFLQSTVYQTSKYLTGSLGLRFKKILTDLIHADYFENMVYYKISHVDHRISNPEQRIASDIPKFCSELSELVQDDLIAVADGLIYIWRLCSYASPKYVLWILAYVLGAGGTIRKFSPSFGKLKSTEQQLEGEYRQVHSRLRTHAESVAFYGGENREASHIMQRFQALVRHLNVVLHENWWFGMIQDFLLKYLGATVGVILIVEPFFAGNLKPDTSTLGRAEMLSNLRYHTSVIISLFQSLGTLSISSRRLNLLSGYADRIHELLEVSRDLSGVRDRSISQNSSVRNYISEANYIEFSGVKVVTPSGNVLVDDLTLRVESGSNLLITGPNGSGKSSLFRVLGGLWPLVSGHIVKPGVGSNLNKEIFYVPQRPYTAVGTLRDQLIYPLTADQETEPLSYSGMVDLLKNVDLEYLLERYPLDKEVNWGDELSLGEQQRLGMARLFYHKPKFAILDECTSAVTTDMEERFCNRVRAMGTSCITISHRPALVAFHDIVLSLDGEGGWKVQDNRNGSFLPTESEFDVLKSSETDRKSDALAVQRAFRANTKDNAFSGSKEHSYSTQVIATSPNMEIEPTEQPRLIPQLQCSPRPLPVRAAAMSKILVPKIIDKQGGQLLAVALLVLSRTWISDRIASLNGTSVKYVLEQDKAAFLRLIGVSVMQSAANSIVAPSLRNLTSRIALGWRIRMTNHLLAYYLKRNAFYKVFNMSGMNIDADQRITRDVEKLTNDLAGLVTGMVKPLVDILWFTWRMKLLSGRRGVAILYAYMLLGLGFLRAVSPDFGDLANQEQELEGSFRFMHSRLRTHAESIAFFGGGSRERAMVEARFTTLLNHSKVLLRKKWLYGIFDDFVTKQLPHNVTWGLSMLYALEHKGDRALTSTQGELAHALRFLASVVSQSFIAFGDILELHKKFLELSGGINRIFELEELLHASQSNAAMPSNASSVASEEIISFRDVDIVTPSQKLLASQLSCDVSQGKSLLVTGPNGSGKSSIFRVLRGLWPIASGRLAMPSEGIFHVSQRPYTCLGTLRDQIIYPLSREEAELKMVSLVKTSDRFTTSGSLDDHLKTILENVRLVYLLEREGWDATPNWEDILSLGEQQRLGMARLFFHCPKFGILDECTNATSVDVEEHLYRLATDMGITVVTSSQRPALIPFHSSELKLIDGEGKWELCAINQYLGLLDASPPRSLPPSLPAPATMELLGGDLPLVRLVREKSSEGLGATSMEAAASMREAQGQQQAISVAFLFSLLSVFSIHQRIRRRRREEPGMFFLSWVGLFLSTGPPVDGLQSPVIKSSQMCKTLWPRKNRPSRTIPFSTAAAACCLLLLLPSSPPAASPIPLFLASRGGAAMLRLRSSARLLRKLCEASSSRGAHGRSREVQGATPPVTRWLSGAAAAARSTSLLRPLPGLELPPSLPDQLHRLPTRVTTLPNGVRVASEDIPGPSACVGVFVASGSIHEAGETTGVTHLLEKLAFKDTAHRSHLQIVQEVEATGGNIGASASREQMVYSYDTLKAYIPQAVEVLLDCVRNPLFLQDEVDRQLALAREEVQEVQKNPEKLLQEALNLVGYKGAFANPLVAPEEALERINGDIIQKFYHENYTADRLVLAASGVDHQHLLDVAEPLLSDWHKGSPMERPKSTYTGGDFRHTAESDMTHVALAFEVPGGWLEERNATIMTVIQTLMGGGGSFSSGGPGKGMHSRLYLRVLTKYHAVQAFSAFSNVYDDSGLFGIYLTTPPDFVGKAVEVAMQELIAIATPGKVTEVELTRAKNSTISSVLMNLESRVIVAEDIGRQLLTYGCRKPIDHFLQWMDEITLDDVTAFAQKMLSSQPTMASWGDVNEVPPYEFVSKRFQMFR
ncbi:ABC transporter D family member 1 [Brachypodium distachyon]|nr:ABC transporter D family member 1 [Brachypodium distachyon]|eukprot:XP_024314654.1 ABC transporter D family member 1 [Brachypodium distachyon]